MTASSGEVKQTHLFLFTLDDHQIGSSALTLSPALRPVLQLTRFIVAAALENNPASNSITSKMCFTDGRRCLKTASQAHAESQTVTIRCHKW